MQKHSPFKLIGNRYCCMKQIDNYEIMKQMDGLGLASIFSAFTGCSDDDNNTPDQPII